MSPVETLRDALERCGCRPQGNGDSFKAFCPACQLDGQHHSRGLSVRAGDSRGVVFHCHGPGNCDEEQVLAGAGLSWADLGDGNGAPRHGADGPKAAPTEGADAEAYRFADRLWREPDRMAWLRDYRGLPEKVFLAAQLGHDGERYTIPIFDSHGRVLYIRRYLPGGDPKFTQPKGVQAQLYGIEALAGLPDDALVLVTEGEMDALRCRAAGYNAVSGTAGAKCWREDWTGALARFECITIGDADPDGREMNRRAGESLRKAGALVAPLDWPEGTAPGTDPTDYLREHSEEDFARLVEAARDTFRLRTVDLAAALTEKPEPIPWLVRDWIAAGDLAALAGEPKTGKSWLALHLTLALASGKPWLGAVPIVNAPYRVLYCDEEQNPRLVRHRIRKLARGLGLDAPAVAALPIRYLAGNGLNLDSEEHLARLWREVRTFKPDVVLFDSLVRFHRRNENHADEMAAFAAAVFKPLTAHFGCSALYLHHLAKPGKDRPAGDVVHRVRGSGDLVAGVDTLLTLERNEDGAGATLRAHPGRWGSTADPLTVTLEDSEDGESVTLRAVQMEARAETLTLDALRQAGTTGMKRQAIISLLEENNIPDPTRAATRTLGRLHGMRRIRKAGSTHGVTYWLAEFAPPEAA